jgi:hypothetical protein
VSYPYNAHDPGFTQLFGEASIADAEACNADPGSAACEAVFDSEFSGVDADGDVLEYSIVPVIDNSNVFIIPDPSKLSISYVGNGITKAMDFTILVQVRWSNHPQLPVHSFPVQAKEKRTLDDARSAVTVVKIRVDTTTTTSTATTATTTATTTTTTEPDCDDKKTKLYFIIMIVLASVLGVLLILSCSILIWRKVLRYRVQNYRSTNINAFLNPGHKSQGFNAQNMRSIMKNP